MKEAPRETNEESCTKIQARKFRKKPKPLPGLEMLGPKGPSAFDTWRGLLFSTPSLYNKIIFSNNHEMGQMINGQKTNSNSENFLLLKSYM